jgi:acetyl-CoA acetyltransferase
MAHYRAQDQVAIVGIGSTGFRRDHGRSSAALAAEASIAAIRDAGLQREDIDGVVVAAEPGAPPPHQLASTFGIPTITHHTRPTPVAGFALIDAVNAVYAGA